MFHGLFPKIHLLFPSAFSCSSDFLIASLKFFWSSSGLSAASTAVCFAYSPPFQRRLRISRGPSQALPPTFTFCPSLTVVPLGLMLNSVTDCQLASGAVI